ncbi:MAG: hypothetical protein QOD58_4315 [Mycobacterium sp.]|nr:hypothetical protein [Mycobacterium sp.]
MADRWDIAARLAEGLPAVEHTERYVRACNDPAQIRELYNSEVGLDLHALDADCAQLRAAGTVMTEALRLQRAQVAALAAAWTGPGAQSAVTFLQRHCDVANAVVAEVRAAAQRCESLRDNLWYLVDSKVATVIAIDDRTLAQRPTWLAAAAVMTGAGDRAAAQELVNQQIKPYVDNDIRHDWLTAVRSTQAGVTASYDMVTDRFASAPGAYFEMPGELGPTSAPSRPIPPTAAPATTAVTPAAFSGPRADPVWGRGPSMTPPSSFTATPASATAPPVPSSQPAQPDWGMGPGGTSGLPGGGGGISGMSGGGDDLGGLGGLATRIVQAMGGLLGSAGDEPAESPFDEDTDVKRESDEPEAPKEPKESQPDDVTQAARPVPKSATSPVTQPPLEQPPAGSPAAGPLAAPPVTESPANGPPPNPPPGGSTPCEIAANELPQAGQ